MVGTEPKQDVAGSQAERQQAPHNAEEASSQDAQQEERVAAISSEPYGVRGAVRRVRRVALRRRRYNKATLNGMACRSRSESHC